MTSKKKIYLLLAVLAGVTMFSLASWFLLNPPPLIIQGEVDTTQIQVSSKLFGRVAAVHVKKGEYVKKGQLLISLDSPEIQAKMAQATAAQRFADAQRDKAFTGPRQEELRAYLSNWHKATSAADLAEKTFRRIDRLQADGVVPAQQRDEAEAQWQAASKTAEAVRASYDMALAGSRSEDKTAATAQASQAAGAVAEAKAHLQETALYAPIDGQIVDLLIDPGELVSPGFPTISIVDLRDAWLTFNVREDLLADIRMGDVITARIPALGNRSIKAKVNYISALGDFATWRATKTSGDFDLKTFEVRLTLSKR
ncbi:MAG: HlyD family secretion protein [Desulfovibrionales bacterium]|nr:MAG: HlyD family secretion protein [Desulfovibrionales bacterium]